MHKIAKKQSSSFKLILLALSVIFFLIYCFLSWQGINNQGVFNSPDENANYFFINYFISERSLVWEEPLNAEFSDMLLPRSYNLYFGNYVPGSFMGLIVIYGVFGLLLGSKLIYFLTPLLAVAGVNYFYRLIEKIFDSQVALFSSIILFFLPPFWYYSSFAFFHNILFSVFFIIAFYYLFSCPDNKRNYILSAIFLVFAVWTRTNEIFWIGLILIIVFLVFKEKLYWRSLVAFLFVLILGALLLLHFNNQVYGDFFNFGYNSLESTQHNTYQPETATPAITSSYLLPFGFDINNIYQNFKIYFIGQLWWIFIPSVLGLWYLIKNFKNQDIKKRLYVFIVLIISLYLIIYYGSYLPDDVQKDISGAHLRYFLPVFIFLIPAAVFFFKKIGQLLPGGNFFAAGFILIGMVFSSYQVLLAGPNSLMAVSKNLQNYESIRTKVIQNTEADSIIVTSWADKFLFPERKIISGIPAENKLDSFATLVNEYPVYLFEIANINTVRTLNQIDLYKEGLLLDEQGLIIDNNFSLYKFKTIKQTEDVDFDQND